tara:strand:+ start:5721 stop:7514 length:1794 start_codon:yes stop_codon:yes gene_type:complete
MMDEAANLKNKIYLLFKFIGLKKLFILSIFIILGSLFEVIGIGLIGPFISMLLDNNIVNENIYLNKIFLNSPEYIKNNFITFFGFFLIFIFFIVNSFLASLFYLIEKVARESTADLSISLLKNYFKNDYIFFVKNNSSNLVKNIVIETQQVVHGIVLPILQAIGRIFIIVSIFFLLASINLNLTIFIILFFLSLFFIIFLFVKNKLRKIGIERSFYDKLKFIISNETINSIKEAKILKLENFFLKKFIITSYKYAKIHVKVVVYTIFPKYLIEFIVLSLIVLILLLFNQNSTFLNNLPTLSVFIFAGYRILPGAQLIYSSLSAIKKSEESLNIIYRDLFLNIKNLNENDNAAENEIIFNKSLEFKNVGFSYDDRTKSFINELNFKINKFDKVALVGKTGSGKSTLIDLITGLLKPTKGQIFIDNKECEIKSNSSWQEKINYLPQKMFFLDSNLKENIAIGTDQNNINDKKIIDACNFAELDVNKSSISITSDIGESGKRLSGGEKQRVGIARLFYNMREILIFDESTNAIDINTEEKIFNKIFNLKKTVLFATHNLRNIKKFKKIIFFSNSEIVIGTFDELLNSNNEFKILINNYKD